MAIGDSFRKKVQDAAKAVEKVAAKAAPAPARPPADKPFPARPTPARPGASSKPMFEDDEKTVLDSVLQARIRKQMQEKQPWDVEEPDQASEPEELAEDEVFETDDEKDRTAAASLAVGLARHHADEDDADEDSGDDDSDDADSGGDGEFEIPPGWGADDLSNEEFWGKAFDVEDAQMKGGAALKKALAKYGLQSEAHYAYVREQFMAAHGNDPDFQQAMINARVAQTRSKMSAAAGPELLAPIDGVSLETYATLQARRGKLQPQTAAAFGKLLAEYKLDAAKWAKVDKAWMARMSDPSDPMATAAVNTEYAKYFAAAGQGQFGAGAKAASKNLGVKDAVGKAPAGGEPCTFERYVEIMTAQTCWAQQGKDVNAMLQKAFKMSAMDFSNLGAYWSQKMMADIKLMTEVMPALQAKYTKRYSAPSQDDDLDI